MGSRRSGDPTMTARAGPGYDTGYLEKPAVVPRGAAASRYHGPSGPHA